MEPQGVEFVGIDTREDDAAQALAFQRRYGITYPSLVDDGGLLLALRGAVPPTAIPSTLVLDTQGRIAARISGPVPSVTTLVDLVEDVQRAAAVNAEPARAGAGRAAAAGRCRWRCWPAWSPSSRRACCRWCRATSATSPG